MFSQLKARRSGVPAKGTSPVRQAQAVRFGVPARAVRPLGFAAVAVAAAVTVAGCKPGSYSGASSSGSQFGTTSSSPTVQVMTLAAQQAQQVRSFTANLEIQATGNLNATLFGTLNEVTTPTPLISINANAGSLGNVQLILNNGMAYLKSPLVSRSYGKPWMGGTYSAMSSSSGLNLGSLINVLQTSSPMVQTQMFGHGSNERRMGSMMWNGMRTTEYGGHYNLASVLGSLSSSMQPMMQSEMNSGINMTRFRVWMDQTRMIRKMILIELGNNTRITITLTITSINQPMQIQMPSTTLIFILPGTTTTTPTATPTITVKPTTTVAPTPTATMPVTSTPTPGMSSTPTPAVPAPSSMPTHW